MPGRRRVLSQKVRTISKIRWRCAEGHEWHDSPTHIKEGRWCPYCRENNPKHTIEECIRLASEHGGKCLSAKMLRVVEHLKWECVKGHRWQATFDNIRAGKWCPTCANNQKKTVADYQSLAQKRGGKCLSTAYINSSTKLEWECSKGHRWSTAPNNIRSGTWCPVCSGRMKVTINDCQAAARKHGGKCLSKTYISGSKLEWECSKGHRWKAVYGSLHNNGSWCPYCAGKHITINDCRKAVSDMGGKLLTSIYNGSSSKLKCVCASGHTWITSWDVLKQGRKCPACMGRPKLSLGDCINTAKERGGECLSVVYKNTTKDKMLWRCAKGHEWTAIYGSIRSGSWCPVCAGKLNSPNIIRR